MADLSRISPLVGRTLAGRAQAEGTLAGTSTDPTVAGTVKASSVKVDTVFEALSVDGTLDARIPGRDVSAFTGSLKTNSTLVTVAGRQHPGVDGGGGQGGRRAAVPGRGARGRTRGRAARAR